MVKGNEIPVKFHRFNQFIILPLSLIGSVFEMVRIVMNSEQYISEKGTAITFVYALFFLLTALLNVVTQIGFIRLRGYSYYSYLSIQMLNMVNAFFMYSYIYDANTIANMMISTNQGKVVYPFAFLDTSTISATIKFIRSSMGLGIIFGLALSVIIIFYYMKRKCLFIFIDRAERKKRRNDIWANNERYVPGRAVRMSRKEEKRIANRRLTGVLDASPKAEAVPQEEADIYASLK